MAKQKTKQKRQLVPPPSVDELNNVLGPARDARRAREALGFPTRFTLPRPTPETLKSKRLATKYRAEMHKFADERMRTGLAQSKSLQAFLDGWVAARRVAVEALSGLFPATQLHIIDRPYRILTTGGLRLVASRPQSMASYAKVKTGPFYSEGWTSWELIFCYTWQNTTGRGVVIRPTIPIILNGQAWVWAGYISEHSSQAHSDASLRLSVELEAFDWLIPPATVGVSSGAWVAANLHEYNDGGLGHGVGQNIFRGFSLDTGDLFVNSGQWKVFDLVLKISAHIHNGGISVDFSRDDFQVASPWALLRITNLEPELHP